MSTYVFKDGAQQGPFEDTELLGHLSSGFFSHDDLGWREGLAEWTPLRALFPKPPPTLSLKPPSTAATAPAQAAPAAAISDPLAPLGKFVRAQIKEGKLLPEVTRKLVEMGVEESVARPFATRIFAQNANAADTAQFKRSLKLSVLVPAMAASGGAGVAGGVIWGLVIIYTGYELGILAWGLGALCGAAALWAGRQIRGPVLQAISMFSTLFAVFLGKYIGLFYYFQRSVLDDEGPEAAAQISFFSLDFMSFFSNNFILLFGGRAGVIFFILALTTAWKIPSDSIVHD